MQRDGVDELRLAYDGLGRRRLERRGKSGSTSEDVVLEYDGPNVIQETSVKTGDVVFSTIHAPAIDAPIAAWFGQITPSTTIYDLGTDARGDVTVATKNGSDYEEQLLDPYGEREAYRSSFCVEGKEDGSTSLPVQSCTELTVLSRFGIGGARQHPATKLVDLRNRVYATHLRGFLTKDPMGAVDSDGLYNYVAADPVNLRDPWGLEASESVEPKWIPCEQVNNCTAGNPPPRAQPERTEPASSSGWDFWGWLKAGYTGGGPCDAECARKAVASFGAEPLAAAFADAVTGDENGGDDDAGGGDFWRGFAWKIQFNLAMNLLTLPFSNFPNPGDAAKTPTERARELPGATEYQITSNALSACGGGMSSAACGKAAVDAAEMVRGLVLRGRRPACFVADTPVLMCEGNKAIEDVRPGDLVLSRDATTGEYSCMRVARTFIRESSTLIVLELDLNGVEQTVITTPEHPFMSDSNDFVEAGNLKVGGRVATATGLAEVLGAEVLHEPATVYNFEVERTHTYFVGELGAWVHNACLPTGPQRIVNSNMGHAAGRAVERAGFQTPKAAREALQEFGTNIEKNGLPSGAIRDPAHADRVIVPGFGNGGAVVYQEGASGFKLKTVLTWIPPGAE